ncbi:hypothetical protein CY35_14G033000 [Sphagnum magellanicum]|nr:hypothetical protein CY35_14G033000 [Sphagnum magellanicum]
MPGNPDATVYVGNLDERVDERVVYEIMVQAGPLVDVYFPRDKDSKRHKGYGFAEYETEESAQYALRLFSGLVYLCNRSVRFAISGERSAQPARYDPDSSRLFARSHEKDGDSWQMTPPQHPNYVYLNHSPTAFAGMRVPGLLTTVAQTNAQLAALRRWDFQGHHHSNQHAYASY